MRVRSHLSVLFKATASLLAFILTISPVAPAFAVSETVTQSLSPAASTSVSSTTESIDANLDAAPATEAGASEPTGGSDTPKQSTEAVVPDGGESLLSGEGSSAPTIDNPNLFTYESSAPKVDQSTGALTERIDLEIPPGRNGLTPDLALLYNSQQLENGVLGFGWTLSIPYIERLNKTGSERFYIDNYFTSSMGGELASTTGNEYRHRIDDGSFITFTFSNNVWTAYDKNGTRYLFGTTTQSRQAATTSPNNVYKWMLEEVRDANDNFIRFEYAKYDNQIYPSKIYYTGYQSTDGIFTVEFATSTRSDALTSYESGFNVTTNHRITQVTASVNGSWVRKYTLSYGTGGNGARSLLSSVQETGRDESGNELTVPAISFNYSTSTPQYVSSTNPRIWNSAHIAADVDGNALPDRSVFWSNSTTSSTTRDIDENEYPSFPAYSLATTSEFWSFDNNSSGADDRPPVERGTRFFDMNGDGRADIVKGFKYENGTITREYYPSTSAFVWNATSSTYGIPIFACETASGNFSSGVFGNINGDGLSDYVASSTLCSDVGGAFVNRGTTDGWAKADSFAAIATMTTTTAETRSSQLVDINGDGLDDWMYSANGAINFHLNTGTNWGGADARWTIATGTRQTGGWDKGIRFIDLNGDNLPDYVRSYTMPSYSSKAAGVSDIEVGSYNYVYLNTGVGFATTTAGFTAPEYIFTGVVNAGEWAGLINYNEPVDWNGDGILDSAGLTSTSTATALPDILISTTYGTGGRTVTTHKLSSQMANVNPELPFPVLVVTKILHEDNLGGNENVTYAYEGGKIYFDNNVRDRRFAGFRRIVAQDALGSVQRYHHQGDGATTALGEQVDNFSLLGKPFREDIVSAASTTLRRTFTRWDTDANTSVVSANSHSTDVEASSTQYWSIDPSAQSGLNITGDLTIAGWFKFESEPGLYGLVARTGTPSTQEQYYIGVFNSGGVPLRLEGRTRYNTGTNTIARTISNFATSTWYHFAFTSSITNTRGRLYINGSQMGADESFWSGAYQNPASIFYIGRELSTGYHDGLIDEVRVWSRELTASEISSLYSNSASFNNGSNLAGWWKFNDNANDYSNNGNTLNNNNNALFSTDTAFTATTTLTDRWFSRVGKEMVQDFGSGSTHKDRAVEYTYATSTGDVTNVVNLGEVTGSSDGTYSDVSGDTVTKVLSYAGNSSINLRVPAREIIANNASTTVKESKFYYDNSALGSVTTGNLTKQENWISGSDWASSTKAYNGYGLPTSDVDPRSNTTTFTYETNNLYVSTSTNALSHVTGYAYDLASGKKKRTIDPNSRTFESIFDPVGRVKEVKVPDPSSGSLVTMASTTYTDNVFPRKRQETRFLNSATSTDSYTYLDGFGRTIQERVEFDDTNYAVKDNIYGNHGLLASSSLPYLSSGSARTTATTSSTALITYSYDAARRPLTIVNSEGTETHSYEGWKEAITDRESNIKHIWTDSRGNLGNVVEHINGSPATTTYAYDALNNLSRITDASGNVRNFYYDGLSRATSTEDLHASGDGTFGTWSYVFDLAGNVTQVVDPKSQTVARTYDAINRVLTEDYTAGSGTEMTYQYDSCGNGTGRLCIATTTDAVLTLTYSPPGSIASEARKFGTTTYTTSFTYDRQGNLATITYPDNSSVRYDYDIAGLLDKVSRAIPGSSAYSYVLSDIDYASHGKPSYLVFGNNVETTYTYDPSQLLRLTKIRTTAPGMGGMGLFDIDDLSLWSGTRFALAEQVPESNVIGTEVVAEPDPAVEDAGEHALMRNQDVPSSNVEVQPADSVSTTTPISDIATTTEITNSTQTATSSPESSILESLLSLGEATSTLELLAASTTMATSTEESTQGEVEKLLSGKSPEEKADIKGQEIAKIGSLPRTERNDFDIEIESIKAIGGGVQAFARAWRKDGTQIGFGADGTVDLERFQIFNPPILVPDEKGTIIRRWIDRDGIERERRFREDPQEALLQVIEHGLSIMQNVHGGENIVPGKVGNTTSMFYPAAGANSPVDGHIGKNNSTWSGARDAASGDTGRMSVTTTESNVEATLSGTYFVYRSVAMFNTSTIDTDSISSATLSLYEGSGPVNANSTSLAVVAASTSASNNLTESDFNIANFTTELANRLALASMNLAAYNDFALNASGRSHINKTGVTKFGVRLARDVDNSTPTGTNTSWFFNADQAGTTQDPKLVVEHTAAGVSPYIQDIDYVYDSVGNITEIAHRANNVSAKTTIFRYDTLYRLTMASTTAASSTPFLETYAYNALGNVTGWKTNTSATSTYVYGATGYANPHAVTDLASTTYAYDNNGNVTSAGSKGYTWDYRNRLSAAGETGQATTTFGYDHQSNRVFKKVGTNATTTYVGRYYELSGATSTAYIFLPSGELIATVTATSTGTTTNYVHPDHLGSTNAVTDEDASVVQTLDYYPYGSERIDNGTDISERQYIGERFDEEVDLSYLNARYYEGVRGQFLSQDPTFLALGNPDKLRQFTNKSQMEFLSDPQQLNSYSYGRNNPIKNKDPKGEAIVLAPLFWLAVDLLEVYGAAQFGYWSGQMINSHFLFRDDYTNTGRSDINYKFAESTVGFVGGPFVKAPYEKAILTLGPNIINAIGHRNTRPNIYSNYLNIYNTASTQFNTWNSQSNVSVNPYVYSQNIAYSLATGLPSNTSQQSGSGGGGSSSYTSQTYQTPNGAIIDWGGNVIVPAPK